MADNYLEKRMDDYRRGLNHSSRRRVVTPSGAKPLTLTQKLRVRKLLVAIADSDIAQAVAAAFASLGCTTIFLSDNLRLSQAAAQRIGAQAWPVDGFTVEAVAAAAAAVIERREGLDLIITNLAIPASPGAQTIRLIPGAAALSADSAAPGDGDAQTIVCGNLDPATLPATLLSIAALPRFPRLLIL